MRNIENYTEEYEKNSFEMNVQVKYRRKMMLKMLDKYAPDKILEIGCGLEPIFKHIDLNCVSGITIVEPSERFCRNAEQFTEQMPSRDKIKIIKGFFEDEKDNLNSEFDLILCSGLLHEVEEPKKLLHAIKDVCTENTVVHINVPNAFSLHRILAYEMGIIEDVHQMSDENKVFQQHSVFDMKMLCELMENCGFQIVEKGTYFCKPFTHGQMQQMCDVGIMDEKMLEGFDRLVKYMPEYGSEIFVNVKVC